MAGGAEFGRLGVEVGVLEGAIKLDGNGETELEYACKIISELLFIEVKSVAVLLPKFQGVI